MAKWAGYGEDTIGSITPEKNFLGDSGREDGLFLGTGSQVLLGHVGSRDT